MYYTTRTLLLLEKIAASKDTTETNAEAEEDDIEQETDPDENGDAGDTESPADTETEPSTASISDFVPRKLPILQGWGIVACPVIHLLGGRTLRIT